MAETEDIRTTPSRPALEWQGKLMEAQSAGRDCPGSGAAGPQSGYGLDRNTRHGRIYCALLALIPVTKLVSHVAPIILPANSGRNIVAGTAPTASLAIATHRLLKA